MCIKENFFFDSFIFAANGKCRSSVECFNFKTKTWSPVTPMKHARKHATAVVLDGSLYVAGGLYEKKDLCTIEKYNPSMESWEQVATLRNSKGIQFFITWKSCTLPYFQILTNLYSSTWRFFQRNM